MMSYHAYRRLANRLVNRVLAAEGEYVCAFNLGLIEHDELDAACAKTRRLLLVAERQARRLYQRSIQRA